MLVSRSQFPSKHSTPKSRVTCSLAWLVMSAMLVSGRAHIVHRRLDPSLKNRGFYGPCFFGHGGLGKSDSGTNKIHKNTSKSQHLISFNDHKHINYVILFDLILYVSVFKLLFQQSWGELQTKPTFCRGHSLTVFMSMLFCRETWCVIGHFTQQLRLPGIFDGRLLYGWCLLGKMGLVRLKWVVPRNTCILCFELISFPANQSNVFPMCWILDTKLFKKFKGVCVCHM